MSPLQLHAAGSSKGSRRWFRGSGADQPAFGEKSDVGALLVVSVDGVQVVQLDDDVGRDM